MKSFKDKTLGRYTETVLQICQFLFKKMQFSLEQNELDLLDFEELDENVSYFQLFSYIFINIYILIRWKLNYNTF